MKPSLRPRPVVLGIVLAAAGAVMIFLSFRPREQVLSIAPGVHLVRPASQAAWELLVDSTGGGEGAPKGGAEAQNVTQYAVLSDGRAVVEGSVDGAESWLLIGPAGSEGPAEGASILAMFPSRASLEEYLKRQGPGPLLMSPPAAGAGNGGLIWGGTAMTVCGSLIGVLGVLFGAPAGRAALRAHRHRIEPQPGSSATSSK